MIKKAKLLCNILICAGIILNCCGCMAYISNDSSELTRHDYFYESKSALLNVYNALLDGDSKKLKSLLCEELREQDDVDEQIEQFMENTGGGLKSGDLNNTSVEILARERDYGEEFGEYTVLCTSCDIENAVCKNGEQYHSFSIGYMYVNKHKPKLQGVYSVSIVDNQGIAVYRIAQKEFMPKYNSQTEDS